MTARKIPWRDLSARAGRNDLPAILVNNYRRITKADLPEAVADAWTMPEWPEQHMEAAGWVSLFDRVGLITDDGVAVERETLPEIVTLYRGAIPSRREGLSWTDNLATAQWFAHRFDGIRQDEGGKVWKIEIPSDFVLARFERRGEHEYVVDTTEFDESEYEEVA